MRYNQQQLQELYQKHNSLSLVAKELNGTKEGIRCAMNRFGLKINPKLKHTVDNNFFNKENEESFYWAGFIAADGCVNNRHRLNLGLSILDQVHLNKLRLSLNYSGTVKSYSDSTCELSIYSKQICNDLQKKFNIIPRKSLVYTFPNQIKDHDLINHFMRGYFDGDGSLYYPATKKLTPQLYFNLRGTSQFLNSFKDILNKNCYINDKTIRLNGGIYSLDYGGNKITKKIMDFLYKNSSIFLERKFNKYKLLETLQERNYERNIKQYNKLY